MAADDTHPPDAPDPRRPPHRRRRRWMRMLLYLLIALLLWAMLVWFAQRSIMFPRYLIDAPRQPDPPADAEIWHHDSPAGEVEAWFLPGRGVSADAPGPAVVFAHGNGEIIDDWPAQLETYRQMGVSVLLPEYRGYGRSAGSPSQHAITQDFIAFHDRLAARDDVDAQRIVFHGRSIGCGALASLARHRTPAAMILQSSFTSAAALAKRYLVPRFMVRDPFDVRAVIGQYQKPVLLLHGKADGVIPARHSQRLHEAAAQSELVLYDGWGHNDPPPRRPYWRQIYDFLLRAGILSRDAVSTRPGRGATPQ